MTALPELAGPVQDVIHKIKDHGASAYVVGGAVRDLLLGKAPQDWDISATLTPVEILALFPEAKPIGGVCGTMRLPMRGMTVDITPCRAEGAYSDHRHPDKVEYVPDILRDLSRRDFTINAMAYDGLILLDPFGGQEDLANGLLRCVGNPMRRFSEDPLRILRLYRFSATLGFTAEWNTFCAANDLVGQVSHLSRERVRDELRVILLSNAPQVLSPFIARGGLYRFGFSFAPSLAALQEVPALGLCRWWALMAMCGADPDKVGREFGFSRRDMAAFSEYTRLYRLGPARNRIELKKKLRNTRLDYVPVAATFAAVSPHFAGEPVMFAAIYINKEPYRLQDLAVNGDMLRYEGISGKKCGRILDELLSVVIKNPAMNRAEALLGIARSLQQVI